MTTALDILRMRSERNKVGVPANRSLISLEQAAALQECIDNGWLAWIDSERHPAAGWQQLDVFLVTPAGLRAAKEAA